MRFYHCFYTDLPDQFVEANAATLIAWVDGWKDKNRYYLRSKIIDTIPVDVIGDAARQDWPTLRASSDLSSYLLTELWMLNKGDQYNGRYRDTLAPYQRDPHQVASHAGGRITVSVSGIVTAADIAAAQAAARAGRWVSIGQVVWASSTEVPENRPSLKRDGIVAGEIIGYRCWRVESDLLRSVYQPDVWHPGHVLEGRGLEDWGIRGVHAWKDRNSKYFLEYLRNWLDKTDCKSPRPAMATGTVFLWGDVVEHERGWRAEYARVRSLDWLYPDASMMGREQEVLDGLRRKYRVDKNNNTGGSDAVRSEMGNDRHAS